MLKRGFTLIELLVVIAIIAILAAILFPVFARAKEQAKATAELSQAYQIGLAEQMYLTDCDDEMPIFYEYNSQPPAGQPGHKGVEVELFPYCKNAKIFDSPFDDGGPYTGQDVPGATSYWQAYGSSFRFTHCVYSVVANESSQNNIPYTFNQPVNAGSFQAPTLTRAMRLEIFPFFSGQCDKYGYDCPAPYNYYSPWSSLGGSMIFVDSHAKHIVNSGQFDNTAVDPSGDLSGAWDATDSESWYYACD